MPLASCSDTDLFVATHDAGYTHPHVSVALGTRPSHKFPLPSRTRGNPDARVTLVVYAGFNVRTRDRLWAGYRSGLVLIHIVSYAPLRFDNFGSRRILLDFLPQVSDIQMQIVVLTSIFRTPDLGQ
jgi:hypothetical protein